jgi:hypothetical protein
MKFKTTVPHYLPGDRYVEAETEIGDGTRFPVDFKYYPPTFDMEPLDAEAKAYELPMRNDPLNKLSLIVEPPAHAGLVDAFVEALGKAGVGKAVPNAKGT